MSPLAALTVLPLLMCLSCGSSFTEATDADHVQCPSQWCGSHNISKPFRLQDSTPLCSGDQWFNLSCEEDDKLILYWKSGKFKVQSINYNNYTIRLVDANHNNSSFLPPYSLTSYNFSYDPNRSWFYTTDTILKQMLYMRCPYDNGQVLESSDDDDDDSNTAAAATCIINSSANNFYVTDFYASFWGFGMGDSCRIEWMYPTSWPAAENNNYSNNLSCTDIHNMLLYGFELSWAITEKNHRYNVVLAWIETIAWFMQYVIVLSVPVKFVLGGPFVIIFLIYKWRRRHLSIYDSIEDFLRSDNSIMPIRYSYKDIKSITDGFKTKLGNGGYGSVFRGKLRSGRLVAVKVLNKAKSNGQDFINEVVTIGTIHHVNVVQLIGFCVEGSKRALIYELMQNGSLEKYIFSNEETLALSCEKLYSISLGVARGIEYLHNGCDMKILHFDIKPHNILLDENFNPKVSDFGLARLYPTDNSFVSLTAARGTIGYMAPELFYRNIGAISNKADVYSLGMLLMEIAGRRKNLNALNEHSSQIYYPFWVYDQLHDGKEIAIENDTDEETKLVKRMMIVALWCIQTKPSDRPSMAKVVEILEQDEDLLEMPPKPYFYDPNDVPAAEDHVADHNSSRLFSEISVSNSKDSMI